MTRLVLAEKPSVARDIARALAGRGEQFTRTDWGFESANWLVAAARGHLLAELNPDEYDAKYKAWSLDLLPIIPDPPRYKPRDRDAGNLLKTLASLANRDSVTGWVNACDAGREGELIFALVYQHTKSTKPVERAWFSSMTDEALCAAFDALRPGRDYLPLEAAARCRSSADWVVGINATRAATVQFGRRELVSIGRVQTPTLALVARRDIEIDNFVATEFYTVQAGCVHANGTFDATWFALTDGEMIERFDTMSEAQSVVDRCALPTATIVDVAVKDEQVKPPRLFDLTTLQQEANRRYGFAASRTLTAAQELYEVHKLTTYPRTDSQFLTSDMAATIPDVLDAAGELFPDLDDACKELQADGTQPWTKLVNDKKVTDHHAIILTGKVADITKLSLDCRRILEMVARRFVAAQHPPASFQRTRIVLEVPSLSPGPDRFHTKGSRLVDAGWKAVYPGRFVTDASTPADASEGDNDSTDEPHGGDLGVDSDAERLLPKVAEGDTVELSDVTVVTGLTKAPPSFTEASLLGAMATAGKLVDDEELADAMKDSGLGTPATRASIIERLIKVGYIERKKKQLKATVKGKSLIGVLADHALASPQLTGSWESRLRQLERCNPNQVVDYVADFDGDVRDFTVESVEWFTSLTGVTFATAEVLGVCPIDGCGGQIIERVKSWSCDSWKSKDEPGCTFAIWKEQGGRKLTKAQALKVLAQSPSKIVPRTPAETIASCPSSNCGGQIVERVKSWSCNSWKSASAPGCGFVIWRSSRDGTELSRDDALAMIERNESHKAPPQVVLADCPMPRCKGKIVERAKSFSCTSWSPTRKGCGLVVWKTDKAGVTIATADQLGDLLPLAAESAQRRKKR